ncbi:MAG TPA: ATP-dependent Clp protease ATP-binding subunit [Spirochaetota bacterium]|nr:ATP-dependent Clp protease ATP-binding subunit [Spirochaetota bacterium]
MFEFTKRSKKVLEIMAQSEGKRLNSDMLDPDHIMISLLKDEESVAARIMKNLGINFEKFIQDIEQSVRRDRTTIILGKVPLSTKYKRIIEMSKEEARKLRNSYIGTEHLLLAIFREGSCSGLDSLIRSGIDYNVIRNEILRVLGVKVNNDKQAKVKTVKPPALEEFARDLTKMASEGMLDPVIGRDDEINRVIRILSRKRKNNPILIGEAGVGKTAIVEGLAQRIVRKEIPEPLYDKRVLSLDMAAIVAGTKYRGEFEERLKRVVKEIIDDGNIIIFIDEVHTLIGAGAAEGAIDAANILKPALARGELQCIGATTINEYKMYVEKDTALVRRFQSILVEEPDVDETIKILKGLKERFESHHKVRFNQESLVKAAVLADRYINDRCLPDKAIDVIDEAGAMARLENFDMPEDIIALEAEIDGLITKKNELVLSQEYEQAAAIRDMIHDKREILTKKMENWHDKKNEYEIMVTPDQIALIVSESTGIPVKSIEESESDKLIRMEEEIHKRIIGQDDAIRAVSRAIRRSRTGLGSGSRPMGAFIFLGPTGVGKTELAKALAEFLFDDERNLIRVDMSEYMEKHSVSRLIGAPPGYIGYEEGGQLTEKIKRRPYSVVLLDEIEKAHPDVFNILLQVFEEGELTDGSGSTISFRDTIIIMTSNIGNREYQKIGKMGFGDDESRENGAQDKVSDELKRLFSPEFLNRIDEVVYFHKLDRNHIRKIVDLMLSRINEKLWDRKIELVFSSGIKKYLIEKGFDENFGARNLRRVIQSDIEDSLANELLKGAVQESARLKVVLKGKAVAFKNIGTVAPGDDDEGDTEGEFLENSPLEIKGIQ